MLHTFLKILQAMLILFIGLSIEKAIGPPVVSAFLFVIFITTMDQIHRVILSLYASVMMSVLYSVSYIPVLVLIGVTMHGFSLLSFLKQRLFLWLGSVALALCVSIVAEIAFTATTIVHLLLGMLGTALYTVYRYTPVSRQGL